VRVCAHVIESKCILLFLTTLRDKKGINFYFKLEKTKKRKELNKNVYLTF